MATGLAIKLDWDHVEKKKSRAPPISQTLWEEHRQSIYELYMTQKLSRQEVLRRVRREPDFMPSERQFTNQVERWEYWKYDTASKKARSTSGPAANAVEGGIGPQAAPSAASPSTEASGARPVKRTLSVRSDTGSACPSIVSGPPRKRQLTDEESRDGVIQDHALRQSGFLENISEDVNAGDAESRGSDERQHLIPRLELSQHSGAVQAPELDDEPVSDGEPAAIPDLWVDMEPNTRITIDIDADVSTFSHDDLCRMKLVADFLVACGAPEGAFSLYVTLFKRLNDESKTPDHQCFWLILKISRCVVTEVQREIASCILDKWMGGIARLMLGEVTDEWLRRYGNALTAYSSGLDWSRPDLKAISLIDSILDLLALRLARLYPLRLQDNHLIAFIWIRKKLDKSSKLHMMNPNHANIQSSNPVSKLRDCFKWVRNELSDLTVARAGFPLNHFEFRSRLMSLMKFPANPWARDTSIWPWLENTLWLMLWQRSCHYSRSALTRPEWTYSVEASLGISHAELLRIVLRVIFTWVLQRPWKVTLNEALIHLSRSASMQLLANDGHLLHIWSIEAAALILSESTPDNWPPLEARATLSRAGISVLHLKLPETPSEDEVGEEAQASVVPMRRHAVVPTLCQSLSSRGSSSYIRFKASSYMAPARLSKRLSLQGWSKPVSDASTVERLTSSFRSSLILTRSSRELQTPQ